MPERRSSARQRRVRTMVVRLLPLSGRSAGRGGDAPQRFSPVSARLRSGVRAAVTMLVVSVVGLAVLAARTARRARPRWLLIPVEGAVGWWTHTWARALTALGRGLARGAERTTRASADALAALPATARRGVGWWTDTLARAVPATGHYALRAAGWAQQQAAVGARAMVYRGVPKLVAFLGLATAVIVWVLLVTTAAVPALSNYDDIGQWAFDMPKDTTLPPLPERSVVYAADGSKLAVLHDEQNRRLVPLDRLPDHVWQAAVAAEDRRFFEHNGYDVQAIGRAALANLRAGDIVQGGSTITQQLAKQNFLSNAQTFQRKAAELTYAIALEKRLSKKELLERYVNQVYFGAGAYGIAAGAEEFFGVPPEELTPAQAALLGGLIRAPVYLDPREHPERAKERRDAVLEAMAKEGYLTHEQLRRSLRTPIEVLPHRERKVPEPYVVEEVKRAFFAKPAFGETRKERIEYLFEGGLKVYTTIKPRLQHAAHRVVRETFPPAHTERTAALATVDPQTGQTLAFHSGTNFEAEQFDLATQGRRQPGSAFKMFVLATALQEGWSLTDTVSGVGPRSFDWTPHQEPWRVRNFGGASYGTLTLREALVNSVNTAFAQLILEVGVADTVDTAQRFGIKGDEAFGPLSARGPAIAIGGLHNGVTTREMASAIGAIANGGEHIEPYVIQRVVGPDGDVIYRHKPKASRAVSSQTAGTMIHAMQQVVARGTGTAADISGRWVAGKTGTSQRFADAWFVGTTPNLSTAVWVGNPDGRIPYYGMTGGGTVAPIWHDYMTEALRGIEPEPFNLPPPVSRQGVSGQEASATPVDN